MSVEAAGGERVEIRPHGDDGATRLRVTTRHGVQLAAVRLDRWAGLQHADETVGAVRGERPEGKAA